MTPYYHDNVTYNLTITNTGNNDYTDVLTVIDSLPDGLEYVPTASITGGVILSEDVNGQVITWTITNISAKSSAIIAVTVYVNTLEKSTNNLTLIGPNGTEQKVNCTIDPVPFADLEVIKLVSNATAHKGDLVNWTLIAINHGPNDAENVVVICVGYRNPFWLFCRSACRGVHHRLSGEENVFLSFFMALDEGTQVLVVLKGNVLLPQGVKLVRALRL